MSKKQKTLHGIIYFAALIWGAITLLPLVVTVLSSFKNNTEIYNGTFTLPEVWRVENYARAADVANALVSIRNSLLLAVGTVILVSIIGMMSAYILSRKRLFFIKPISILFMLGIMIPIHCTIIPISSMATQFNTKNSYFFLLLIYVTFNLAQAIFIYNGFLNGVDRELDEAAIIDGCSDVSLLLRILVPVCKPALATQAIFVFVYAYGELIFSLTLISDYAKFTVARSLLAFTGEHATTLGPQFAFMVMAMIPTVILYLVFHEQVESGMLSGAVKG